MTDSSPLGRSAEPGDLSEPDRSIPNQPEEFSVEQRAGLDSWRFDQDATLDAVHRLESALGLAAPGRQAAWRDDVLVGLGALEQATREEDRNAGLPESLLSDIARTQRRLRHRVRGLRTSYRQLCDAIGKLRHELQDSGDEVDFADVRQRVAWLLTGLRHQRARESDLIYEAYYEAFKRDVEDDLRGQP